MMMEGSWFQAIKLCVVRKRIYRRRVMLILEYTSTHGLRWFAVVCGGFFFFFSILCRAAFNAAYSHTGGQARELVRS